MTTDFRALCVELTDCLEKADWPNRYKVVFQQWTDVARAALAEPDGPAVPEGREPASVAMQPTDEEIMELMPETMRDEFSYAATVCSDATGGQVKPGIFRVCLNTVALEYVRAALARWGTPNQAEIRSSLGDASASVPVSDHLYVRFASLEGAQ